MLGLDEIGFVGLVAPLMVPMQKSKQAYGAYLLFVISLIIVIIAIKAKPAL